MTQATANRVHLFRVEGDVPIRHRSKPRVTKSEHEGSNTDEKGMSVSRPTYRTYVYVHC